MERTISMCDKCDNGIGWIVIKKWFKMYFLCRKCSENFKGKRV